MRANLRGAWRHTIAAATLLLALAGAASAATITIINLDGGGEGFNDPTPAAPVGGNPGTTIGAQRLYVFNYAAAIWGSILPSPVEIRINARFDGQTCDAGGAVLGSAGAGSSNRDFANAPFPTNGTSNRWPNRIAGFDLNPSVNDVKSRSTRTCASGLRLLLVLTVWTATRARSSSCCRCVPRARPGLGFRDHHARRRPVGKRRPGPNIYDRSSTTSTRHGTGHEMASDAQRGASAVKLPAAGVGRRVRESTSYRIGRPQPLAR